MKQFPEIIHGRQCHEPDRRPPPLTRVGLGNELRDQSGWDTRLSERHISNSQPQQHNIREKKKHNTMYLRFQDLSNLFSPSFRPFQSAIHRHQRDSGRLGIATYTVHHSAHRTHSQIRHSPNCVLDGDEGLIKRTTTSKRPAFLLHPPSFTSCGSFFMNQSGSLYANIVLPTYKNGSPPLALSTNLAIPTATNTKGTGNQKLICFLR